MTIAFESIDARVSAINVMLEMTVEEYKLLSDGIKSNPFQRKRLERRDRTYDILREDLLKGCIMPPISLATTLAFKRRFERQIREVISSGHVTDANRGTVRSMVQAALDKREVIILDGIQRTDAIQKAIQHADESQSKEFLHRTIRIELYIGLSKHGILYRMLTLNTGQTPMTLRHQLEIVFSDYLDEETQLEGIEVSKEVYEDRIDKIGKYRFSDIVGLYHAYLTMNPFAMDKDDVLTRLAYLDIMGSPESRLEENLDNLLVIYDRFVKSLNKGLSGWKLDEKLSLERPFGRTIVKLFSRSQPMAGFGYAAQRLIKLGSIDNLEDLGKSFRELKFVSDDVHHGLNALNVVMDEITQRGYYSKIGDYQRKFFGIYFEKVLTAWRTGQVNLVQIANDAKNEFSSALE